jgi:hypothetical protein
MGESRKSWQNAAWRAGLPGAVRFRLWSAAAPGVREERLARLLPAERTPLIRLLTRVLEHHSTA